MWKFIYREDGTAPLLLLLIAMLCTFGVIGFDYSRAHAVKARLQTAADAAALAACMQAEPKPLYEYVFVDASGKETTNPSGAAEIKAKITGWYFDLTNKQTEALTAAKQTFAKNIEGCKMPVTHAVAPYGVESLPNRLPGYGFDAHIDWDSPSYSPDGETYYDKYVIPEAEMGVRTFLLTKLFRLVGGEDVFKEAEQAPAPPDWSGAIKIGAKSRAQAVPVNLNP